MLICINVGDKPVGVEVQCQTHARSGGTRHEPRCCSQRNGPQPDEKRGESGDDADQFGRNFDIRDKIVVLWCAR